MFITLGCWQVSRAWLKTDMLERFESHKEAVLTQVSATLDLNLQYRKVTLRGRIDNQHVFLLDNRSYQHELGYEVVVPLTTSNDTTVLVNLGFVAHHNDRTQLPVIKLISGVVTVAGTLYHPKKSVVLSSVEELSTGWPKVIQSLDFSALSQKLGYAVAPYVVMLDKDSLLAYPSDWQPTVMTPARHFGYAVQWFLLALMVLIATIIYYRRTPRAKGQ